MEFLGVEVAVPPRFLDPETLDEAPSHRTGVGESVCQEKEVDAQFDRVEEITNALLDDAVARARRATERFPRSARSHINLGQALLNRDLAEEALVVFETAVNLDPSNVRAMAGLGQAQLAQNRTQEAEAWFTRILDLQPSDPSALMGVANVELRRGNHNEYAKHLERLIELQPESVMPRCYLGMALTNLGRVNEAIAVLREAARLNPRLAGVHVELGRAFAKREDVQRADQEFRIALALVPGLLSATYGQAQVMVDRGDTAQALDVLNGVLSLDAKNIEALEIRAWTYFKCGDFRKARQDLHRVVGNIDQSSLLGTATHARLLNNLGTCYWSLGNRDDAKAHLFNAIKQASANPIPYLNLGRLLLADDLPGDAVDVLRSCRERFPSDTTCRQLLIRGLDRLNRVDQAIAELRRWVESADAPSNAWATLGYFLTTRKREPALAARMLGEAHKKFPNDPLLANNLAYAFLMQGNSKEARRVLEDLDRHHPKRIQIEAEPVLNATWGLLRLHEGDVPGALSGYEAAEDKAKRAGDMTLAAALRRKRHLEFARAEIFAGNLDAARTEIRLGLEVTGDDPHRFSEELQELSSTIRAVMKNANPRNAERRPMS